MVLLENLKEQGWYLTEDGLNKLSTFHNSRTEDVNKIISLALDWDLRDIAAGALPSKPDCNGTLTGRIVVQLQKIRNISAPKANEESTTAPRFLQLELSDGVNTIAALEFERIANLNLNLPPGTKLFIKSEKLKLLNGFLVLKASDIQVLGGKVEALVTKWELARQMQKYARSNRRLSGSGGPPPWIAFGKRLEAHKDTLLADRNFKSLQAANEKDTNSKENEEFNASRTQAIAEAAKAGQKKVFGGGQQNILDHNVKKILEKGYSEEEAKYALKTTNNNLERALYNLKRKSVVRNTSSENCIRSAPASAVGRVRDRGAIANAKEEATAAKPQSNVSLFDFLTDKFPANISSSNTIHTETVINNANEQKSKDINSIKTYNTKAKTTGCNRFENNMSSSFAANRATVTNISENRQTFQSRSNTFDRTQEERNQQNVNRFGKGERNKTNRTKTKLSTHDNNGNSPASNNKRNERTFKKEQEQTHSQANIEYKDSRSSDYDKTEKKSYQPREINRNNHDSKNSHNNYQQKQSQKCKSLKRDIETLVESTSKLTIQNKELSSNAQLSRNRNLQQTSESKKYNTEVGKLQKPENYSSKPQQKHSSQFKDSSKSFEHNSKLTTFSPQLGNGFGYDTSQIVGFQSKEANEYAMNILKSQGMSMQQQQAEETEFQQLPHHAQTQILNTQTSGNIAYMTQNPNIFVAPPQQVTSQFGMISAENWPWNEGDLCLAKYWDDGNYYSAKITAISEKTCVVLFLGYGNHEEVLKSDCVPIADSQQVPLSTYQANITTSVSQPPAFQQRSNIHGVGNQRYRGERQMYVPPPKRNTN